MLFHCLPWRAGHISRPHLGVCDESPISLLPLHLGTLQIARIALCSEGPLGLWEAWLCQDGQPANSSAAEKTSRGSSYDESTKKGHVLGRPGQFPLLHKENKSLKKSERELPSGQSPVFLHAASNPDCQVSRGLPVLDKAGRQCLVPNAELRRDTNEVGIYRLASTCAFTSAIGWLKHGSAFQQCKFKQIDSLPYCCGLFNNFLKLLQYTQLKYYPIEASLTLLSTWDD